MVEEYQPRASTQNISSVREDYKNKKISFILLGVSAHKNEFIVKVEFFFHEILKWPSHHWLVSLNKFVKSLKKYASTLLRGCKFAKGYKWWNLL